MLNDNEALHAFFLSLPGTTHDYKEEWTADRYMIGDKMYAMLGGDKEGKAILTVKAEPSYAEELRTEYAAIVPGYYMNKTHWNSIYRDAGLPDELIAKLIRHSYEQVLEKLPKRTQREILGDY
ncbi:MmcQ/YjbR family DNA-binding protein [Chryseomicrobium aureum]|uniref:MmcQ/YjbR family DNA-binding protein n=1 Tax=Chryseomicrobium aureum TaxID=1441723 RepID=UPI00370DD861